MSNLSIFKIGIGPSSSHTVGPFVAANRFVAALRATPAADSPAPADCSAAADPAAADMFARTERVSIRLHGSLSLTGKGHLSDEAAILGLSGMEVASITRDAQREAILRAHSGSLLLGGEREIAFSYARDVVFDNSFLPLHENALVLSAFDAAGALLCEKTYYSVGGGFVKEAAEFGAADASESDGCDLPYAFSSAAELLWHCDKYRKNIAEIALLYELNFASEAQVNEYCAQIYAAMHQSFIAGASSSEAVLPGPIRLRRRAPALAKKLAILDAKDSFVPKSDLDFIDYFSLYAMAIAEENAAGARVVTAPTNGACAVVPAVLLYLQNHCRSLDERERRDFLLVAMAIGSLFKRNASISGAEAGCQAEIGSASSMAAAAFAHAMGATPRECCSAAEIAMEHHLGLTCDPVAGLVQIPCIERNTFGAIKAVSAAKMAMNRDSAPSVGLDEVIRTMYETGRDMNSKYKETSLGGLATNYKGMC